MAVQSKWCGMALAVLLGGSGVAGAAEAAPAASAAPVAKKSKASAGKGTAAKAKAKAKTTAKTTEPPKDAAAAEPKFKYHPPDAAFRWDVPKILTEVEVPALMETNGIPNRMHVVVVGLPLHEAYNHFYKHFVDSGLWVAPREEQVQLGEGQVMITGFHPNEENSYSVILAPQSPTRTTVVMGEAYWKDRTFAPTVAFAPVYADAEALLTQNLETGRSLQYSVRAKVEEVETFYSGALSQQGWKKEGPLWVRGGESMHVMVSDGTRPGYVDVAILEVGAPPPEDDEAVAEEPAP